MLGSLRGFLLGDIHMFGRVLFKVNGTESKKVLEFSFNCDIMKDPFTDLPE
jgi:hypothetical protein